MSVLDPFDARRALGAPALLARFNELGVLSAADVHVAVRLAELADEPDPDVLLACALAVRAPRLGHVLVDLASIRETAAVEDDEDVDLSELPWPDPAGWVAAVAASPLTSTGEGGEAGEGGAGTESSRPLRLLGTRLYLERYWHDERLVAGALLALSEAEPEAVTVAQLDAGLERLFAQRPDASQRRAAELAVRRRFTVLAGGPGTGKTTTVARIAALLLEQRGDDPPLLIALAAPTGRAAARLEEAVHAEARELDVDEDTRADLLSLRALTLHRLLGWRPGSHSRFRHDRGNRLPHDVVIVDETSMVPLSLMARLTEATRPDARLILVGDPAQLSSVEAGAVLGDIVAAPESGERDLGDGSFGDGSSGDGSFGDGIVVLDRVHRFGGAIAQLAAAVRRGDADAALEVLASGAAEVTWVPDEASLEPVRERVLAAAVAVTESARAADGRAAIAALGAFRLLCAHRHGADGVATWTARIVAWLAQELPGFSAGERSYAGRPLLVGANDYELQLFNGDVGVVVVASGHQGSSFGTAGGAAGPGGGSFGTAGEEAGRGGRLVAVFERGERLLEVSPARLTSVETAYAMTIHKSQGSQFDVAAVLLPAPSSRILTRELLYTAVTRARDRLILVGGEASIRGAVERPVARASGLGQRLWNPAG